MNNVKQMEDRKVTVRVVIEKQGTKWFFWFEWLEDNGEWDKSSVCGPYKDLACVCDRLDTILVAVSLLITLRPTKLGFSDNCA